MTTRRPRHTRVSVVLLIVNAAAWVMLLVNPGGILALAHCPAIGSGPLLVQSRMLLDMNPISSLMAGWILMLAAMMSPALIMPIRHVVERSFRRRRARSVTLFVAGYTAIWILAGGILMPVVLTLNLLAPGSYLPAIVLGVVAFVWQCSPMKQRCLNRGHNHTQLAAFGTAADFDALRFGITHGVWCAGSCWALMLFPMLLSEGHLLAMAVVTFLIISERLESPKPLMWRLRVRGKLMRILIAQTRIRLHGSL